MQQTEKVALIIGYTENTQSMIVLIIYKYIEM